MSARKGSFDDEEYDRHLPRPRVPRPPPMPAVQPAHHQPLPREELPSPPPAPLPAQSSAEKVSLWGLAQQLAEVRKLQREGFERLEHFTHALVRRSDARTRTMYLELSGDIEDLKAGQAEILLAFHHRDQDRKPIEAAQTVAVKAAEDARSRAAASKVEADEEITGQYNLAELAARRASKTDEIVFDLAAIGAEAAKQHMGVNTEKRRAAMHVETHGAITNIAVRAEGWRYGYKTIAAMCGTTGLIGVVVMALIQRGC